MTPEDTSRMAEKTDRQAQIDPWKDIDDREEYIGGTWYLTRDYVDAARSADAALLRERDAQITSLTAQVEQQTQAFEDECGRHEQTLIGKRGFAVLVAQLGAERDAAQQEIAEQQRDYAILSKMMARETEMLRDEEQENTTLRETLQAAWCELIQHDDQPWVKTLAGQVRVVGLFAFPRPQESQP